MEYFARVRQEKTLHDRLQGLHPPHQRNAAWVARGDTRLPPSERPPLHDASTGQALASSSSRSGGVQQRRDTVCRSHFATKRAGGGGGGGGVEPLSLLDTTGLPRHAWLRREALAKRSMEAEVHAIAARGACHLAGSAVGWRAEPAGPLPCGGGGGSSGGFSGVGSAPGGGGCARRSLLALLAPAPLVLGRVVSFLDLPSLAAAEASGRGWEPGLALACDAWLRGATGRAAPLVRRTRRGVFDGGGGAGGGDKSGGGNVGGIHESSIDRRGAFAKATPTFGHRPSAAFIASQRPGAHPGQRQRPPSLPSSSPPHAPPYAPSRGPEAPRLESWARALRFGLLLEARVGCARLGGGDLACGAGAHHSLVVTPSGPLVAAAAPPEPALLVLEASERAAADKAAAAVGARGAAAGGRAGGGLPNGVASSVVQWGAPPVAGSGAPRRQAVTSRDVAAAAAAEAVPRAVAQRAEPAPIARPPPEGRVLQSFG